MLNTSSQQVGLRLCNYRISVEETHGKILAVPGRLETLVLVFE